MNSRRAFSGIVSGNVKAQGIQAIAERGPFELRGEEAVMALISAEGGRAARAALREAEMVNDLAIVKAAKAAGWDKQTFLEAAAKIEGVYVPSLYSPEYLPDGRQAGLTPHEDAMLYVANRDGNTGMFSIRASLENT